MIRRSVKDFRNEHPVDKRKDVGREEWQLRIERLLKCPEGTVHDGKRHLVRDSMKVVVG